MKIYYFLILSLLLFSCSHQEPCAECAECGLNLNVKEATIEDALNNAINQPKTSVDTNELNASIAKIEEKYGEQWDFCDCVIKGDSINKAFSKPNLPDAEFDRLAARFDVIDEKCQAFRIQDGSRTPEEREAHEKKVKKCLKEAGIKR